MLRDGKFIREEPLKIGAHYTTNKVHNDFTPEELDTQNMLIGRLSNDKISWIEIAVWCVAAYIALHFATQMFKD
jgi:hypothetical protein